MNMFPKQYPLFQEWTKIIAYHLRCPQNGKSRDGLSYSCPRTRELPIHHKFILVLHSAQMSMQLNTNFYFAFFLSESGSEYLPKR